MKSRLHIALGTVFGAFLVPNLGPWNLKNRALPAAGAVFFTFWRFGFGVGLGPQLGAILAQLWAPKRSQVGPKWGSEGPSKFGRFWPPFLMRFGPLLGGNLAAKTGPGRPKRRPGRLKKSAKKGPKCDSVLDPVSDPILGRFWDDFG